MVEPRCFLPKIERKLSEDEFFLDWQKSLFMFLMFSPKNREKIKWRWAFSWLTKIPLQVAFFFGGRGRWGNVASSFYFIFLSLGGPSFFLSFFFFVSFLLMGSNVIVAIVASLFSFSVFFFPFDFLGPEHDHWFFFFFFLN